MGKNGLIERLNEDLAGELSAVIQYPTYAAERILRDWPL